MIWPEEPELGGDGDGAREVLLGLVCENNE